MSTKQRFSKKEIKESKMSKVLGIKMIEMYCDIISSDFAPLLLMIEPIEYAERKAVEENIKKSLGFDKLEAEKAKLKKRINEIDEILKEYTQ